MSANFSPGPTLAPPADADSTNPPAVSKASTAKTGDLRRRWWRIRRGRLVLEWPWLIWILVAGVLIWSVSRGQLFERMNGQVEENYQYIAPNQDGRILKILVKPGDHVEPGGIVAELDPEPWNLQLRALLHVISGQREATLTAHLREHGIVSQQLRALQATASSDEGRLRALGGPPDAEADANAATTGKTTNAKTSPGAVLFKFQQSKDLRTADAGEASSRLTATRAMIAEVEASLAEMEKKTPVLKDAAIFAASPELFNDLENQLSLFNETERGQLQELIDNRSHCRIASAKGGIIDKVVKNPGDYLRAGDPLLEMVGHPKFITAFISDAEAAALRPGDPVWITPAHGRQWTVHESTVVRAAPGAERLPLSSRAGNGSYKAGRRITVAFPASALATPGKTTSTLLPGEGITVHLTHPGDLSFIRKLGTMGLD